MVSDLFALWHHARFSYLAVYIIAVPARPRGGCLAQGVAERPNVKPVFFFVAADAYTSLWRALSLLRTAVDDSIKRLMRFEYRAKKKDESATGSLGSLGLASKSSSRKVDSQLRGKLLLGCNDRLFESSIFPASIDC